jgi:hypothetical protein
VHDNDLFSGHLLAPRHKLPEVRHVTEEVWPSIFLFACLLLIAMVRFRWFAKVSKIVRSVSSRQLQQQLEREEIDPFRFYWVVLNVLLVMNLAFLCWKYNRLERLVLDDSNSFLQFTFFLVIILCVFLIKYVLNRVVAMVSGANGLVSEYSINSTLVNQALGLGIFPLVILIQFGPFNSYVFLYFSGIVIALALLIRWYRGLRKALLEERVGFLQIFSYFCALEILPVLVLVKYIVVTF